MRRTAKHEGVRPEVRSEGEDDATTGQNLGRYQEKMIMESLSESQEGEEWCAVQDGPRQVVLDGALWHRTSLMD